MAENNRLRNYILKTTAKCSAFIAVLFIVFRILLPALVNMHDNVALAVAAVISIGVVIGTLWFSFHLYNSNA